MRPPLQLDAFPLPIFSGSVDICAKVVHHIRMMTITLPDDQWRRIYQFLLNCSNIYVRNESATRIFVESVLWVTRSGAQWRLIPTAYGNWNSIYKRFERWCAKGIFTQMHHHFASDPDMEWLVINSNICRAHPVRLEPQKNRMGTKPSARPLARRHQYKNSHRG